jgi:integrase
MQRKNLTEEGVAKLKAPKGRQFQNHFDGFVPGLVLRVSAKGRKTWAAQYYTKATGKDGKPVTIATTKALGLYPILKVKEAREAARLFLADPEKALAQADTGTVREVAEAFIKRHVEKLRTKNGIMRYLTKHVYPVWQHKQFREIKRGDVTSLLDQIEDKHGARNADMVLAILRKMMNWYQSRNDDYVSPVVKGMGRYNPKDHKRSRILAKSLGNGKHDDQELRTFWNACGQCGSFGALLKMLLLTGQRLAKVATMKHADISTDGVWSIPTEKGEKGNAGTLRLPELALDIIAMQPRLEGNPYVFPGRLPGRRRKSTDGKTAKVPPSPPSISGFNQRKREFDKLLPDDMESWVLHDLRRTARSLLSRAGVLSEISERVLGHAIKGVEGVYDRHSYDAEKADALQRLADLVDRIVNPPEGANVVPLRR